MRTKLMLIALLLLSCSARAQTTRPATTQGPARWEKEIAAYEAKDREKMPAKGGVLFVGASSIRMWNSLEKDFPEHNVINRGFGGSQIADSTHFAERIIFPYEPKMIFLRAGGNDIHAGKAVQAVFEDFKQFVAKVKGKLPESDIVYISMSPAPARWEEREKNKQLNAMIEAFCKETPRLKYVETYDMTLNSDGSAREELFVKDRLHFNEEGYKLMAERVRPFLPK